MAYRAVFLDRDDTIIEDAVYLSDPESIKLLPGVGLAVKSLRQAGYKIVVVTNQSGIARGLLTEDTLERIHSRLRQMLIDQGAMLDAIYYCPFHPEGTVEKYKRESDLRKPGPGMFIKASEQLNIDLENSWMIGDSSRDVAAGQAAGCRTIRLRPRDPGKPFSNEADRHPADFVARNLVEAAKIILNSHKNQSAAPVVPIFSAQPQTTEQTKTQPAERPVVNIVREPAKSIPAETTAVPMERTFEEPAQDAANLPNSGGNKMNNPVHHDDSVVRREILQHVRQLTKQHDHDEFNLLNLFGGLTQVLTLLFLFLVFWSMLNVEAEANYEKALVWGIVGLIFQCMSLTFYTMTKKK